MTLQEKNLQQYLRIRSQKVFNKLIHHAVAALKSRVSPFPPAYLEPYLPAFANFKSLKAEKDSKLKTFPRRAKSSGMLQAFVPFKIFWRLIYYYQVKPINQGLPIKSKSEVQKIYFKSSRSYDLGHRELLFSYKEGWRFLCRFDRHLRYLLE